MRSRPRVHRRDEVLAKKTGETRDTQEQLGSKKVTRPMSAQSRSHLIEHLLEALSLAESLEQQDPPNPVTRAALHHSMWDLLAELDAAGNQQEQGTSE